MTPRAISEPMKTRAAVILVIISVGLSSGLPAVSAVEPFRVLPVLETPQTLETGGPVPTGVLQGDSGDPAIWAHPARPAESLVICKAFHGG